MIAFKTDKPFGYGRVKTQGNYVTSIIEELQTSSREKNINLCNSGVMLCSSKLLFTHIAKISNKNAKKEKYLPDIFHILHNIDKSFTYVLSKEDEINAADFMRLIKKKLKEVDLDKTYLKRSVNDGFSGGEKKRNEILQMLILEPELAVLDETDSGLDIDALKIIAHGINQYRRKDRAIILITHYQRLLKYAVPDYVHVLMNGHIVKSGGKELALELEEKGYSWLE